MHDESRRLEYIDGMRGLAILMVIACHYLPNAADYTFTQELGIFKMMLLYSTNLAWTGVDLFFVISGFLIGGILMRNRESSNFFNVFYVRRFFRIVPAYLIWLAILAAGLAGILPVHEVFENNFPLWAHLTFTQNLLTTSTGTFGSIWEIVTWSLAVEEQFYLVLPLMIWLLPGRLLVVASLACIVAAPLVRIGLYLFLDTPDMAAYTLFPARMDCLFLGVVIAAAVGNERARAALTGAAGHLKVLLCALSVVMALLLFSNWHKTNVWMATGGYTAIAAFYGTALTLAALDRLPGAKLLGLLPLRLAGAWCFSLYLFHVPVHFFVWEGWEYALGRPSNAQNLLVIALSIGLSMVVSAVLMRFVEGPAIRFASRFKYDRPGRNGGVVPNCPESPLPVQVLTERTLAEQAVEARIQAAQNVVSQSVAEQIRTVQMLASQITDPQTSRSADCSREIPATGTPATAGLDGPDLAGQPLAGPSPA